MYESKEVKYFTNGFLIVEDKKNHRSKNLNYQGIEGNVWPLDLDCPNVEKNELQFLIKYIDNNVTSFSDYMRADVINNIEVLNRYINACNKAELKISVLFCETEKKSPLITISNDVLNKDFTFIGFDYGYCGSDYYSCVNSDIGRIVEMNNLKVNEFGLFDTEKGIIEFIDLRTYLKNSCLGNRFELGPNECYTIYKLWKYKGEYPIKCR